jgi:hypothetical protein
MQWARGVGSSIGVLPKYVSDFNRFERQVKWCIHHSMLFEKVCTMNFPNGKANRVAEVKLKEINIEQTLEHIQDLMFQSKLSLLALATHVLT